MSEFEILARNGLSRTGLLRLPRVEINTPAFVSPSSRGAIPHLTPDNAEKCSAALNGGVIMAAEDFFDKSNVPYLKYGRKFRTLLGVPDDLPLFVSPRRCVPVPSPQSNTDHSISVMTSEGFRTLDMSAYKEFAKSLGADVVFGVPDIPNLSPDGRPGSNRAKKMVSRTSKWVEDLIQDDQDPTNSTDRNIRYIVPVLPGLSAQQQDFIKDFWNKPNVIGVSFWSAQLGRLTPKQTAVAEERHKTKELKLETRETPDTNNKASVQSVNAPVAIESIPERLIRCYANGCSTPQEILELINQGIDLIMGTCMTEFTDAGVALDFTFPATADHPVIGYNLWDPKYTTDMTALGRANAHTTPFYARAYIHHLLAAREMTSWVILQMHNVEVMSRFFSGIRTCIAHGTFQQEMSRFLEVYGTTPQAIEFRDEYSTKSSGPKLRSYQVSYETETSRQRQGETKKLNDPKFKRL